MKIIIGTRGSKLALIQAEIVTGLLKDKFPGIGIERKIIHTKGDKILDVALAKVGGKGLFVKEIEEALLRGEIDLAVHSMKDLPSEIPEGLGIGAVLERENPFDAFVSDKYESLKSLPFGAKVGTSSLRRLCQIKQIRNDVEIVTLRGNVETRLRKMREGLDAVILAAAGLRRLGLAEHIREILSPPDFIPAVSQGVIVIESRDDDTGVNGVIKELNHAETWICARAERAFLARLGGGCQVPLGAYASLSCGVMKVLGFIGSPDSGSLLRTEQGGQPEEAELIGRRAAEDLLSRGGREILDNVFEKQENPDHPERSSGG